MNPTAITLTPSMFEQLADQVRCGIAVVDEQLRVLYRNRWMTLHSRAREVRRGRQDAA